MLNAPGRGQKHVQECLCPWPLKGPQTSELGSFLLWPLPLDEALLQSLDLTKQRMALCPGIFQPVPPAANTCTRSHK